MKAWLSHRTGGEGEKKEIRNRSISCNSVSVFWSHLLVARSGRWVQEARGEREARRCCVEKNTLPKWLPAWGNAIPSLFLSQEIIQLRTKKNHLFGEQTSPCSVPHHLQSFIFQSNLSEHAPGSCSMAGKDPGTREAAAEHCRGGRGEAGTNQHKSCPTPCTEHLEVQHQTQINSWNCCAFKSGFTQLLQHPFLTGKAHCPDKVRHRSLKSQQS